MERNGCCKWKKKLRMKHVLVRLAFTFAAGGLAAYCTGGTLQAEAKCVSVLGYEDTVFDSSYVHHLDIIIDEDEWDYMLENAKDEAYVMCSLDYDGEHLDNVGIRPKGNSSLGIVNMLGSEKYNMKLEFDHFVNGQTLHGLDKMALNNFLTDPSCMKDYLAFTMFQSTDIPAPCTAYVMITLNGEPFGLYLALEVPEKSFLQRWFGSVDGNLYKPDIGFENLKVKFSPELNDEAMELLSGDLYSNYGRGDRIDPLNDVMSMMFHDMSFFNFDVAAGCYVGDSPAAYKCIFDSAVFTPTLEHKNQFIASVKDICSDSPDKPLIDTEAVLRYFAVHNFLDNFDSYNSPFAHNFYYCMNDGKLSFVPWDYNSSFGGMGYNVCAESLLRPYSDVIDIDLTVHGGEAMSEEVSRVNYPIDTPFYGIDGENRPLFSSLICYDDYKEQYHEYMRDFITDFFADNHFENLYQETREMIRPYVEQGMTMYTVKQFEEGAQMVHDFSLLRRESINRQLDGVLPSTFEGQQKDYSQLVETGDLDLVKGADFSCFVAALTGMNHDQIGEVADIFKKYLGEDERDVRGLNQLLYDAERMKPLTVELFKQESVQKQVLKLLAEPLRNLLAVLLLCASIPLVKRHKRQ